MEKLRIYEIIIQDYRLQHILKFHSNLKRELNEGK